MNLAMHLFYIQHADDDAACLSNMQTTTALRVLDSRQPSIMLGGLAVFGPIVLTHDDARDPGIWDLGMSSVRPVYWVTRAMTYSGRRAALRSRDLSPVVSIWRPRDPVSELPV